MHRNTKPYDRLNDVLPLADRSHHPLGRMLVVGPGPTSRAVEPLGDGERAEAITAIDTAIDSVGVVLEAALGALTTLGQVREMLTRDDDSDPPMPR